MPRPLLLPAALAACLSLPLAAPAVADPTVGLGLTFVFGGGTSEVGIGLRVFSDDREDRVVGSVGVDYMFRSQRLRPTLGIAYLNRNNYVGVDLGFDTRRGGVDFGIGVGVTDTQPRLAPPAPPPAPVGEVPSMPAAPGVV